MKKVLTILTISLIALAPIFAKTSKTQLITEIEETPVEYTLAYNNDTTIDNSTDYKITVQSLTNGGSTQDFTLKASSNMNKDLGVSVKINTENFKTTLNNKSQVYDSNIRPEVNTISTLSTLKAGLNKDVLVNKFKLIWGGNQELPAGVYVSNVTIEYTIQ
ncbi:MAG: hypothetical protein ACPKNR_00145 [Pleomorphochaeta sp.]|jgi:uncharacterized protein YxeA